jgi:hypothetical protein
VTTCRFGGKLVLKSQGGEGMDLLGGANYPRAPPSVKTPVSHALPGTTKSLPPTALKTPYSAEGEASAAPVAALQPDGSPAPFSFKSHRLPGGCYVVQVQQPPSAAVLNKNANTSRSVVVAVYLISCAL